jgi:hypothetical protein
MVRTLLELLGFVEPDPARREPVALPAWTRHVWLVLVAAFAAACTLAYEVVRALLAP